MLLGISRKEFRQANKLGYGVWENAESRNLLSSKLDQQLDHFCAAMIAPLERLVEATKPFKRLDDRDLNDLALLTLGPTLQARRNVVLGTTAILVSLASTPWPACWCFTCMKVAG